MGLMSYIHNLLLRRGKLNEFLPDESDLENVDNTAMERKAVREDIESRTQDEQEIREEVVAAIRRLQELNKRNHYGESLRRAFGGK
jgi:hypothetical protein